LAAAQRVCCLLAIRWFHEILLGLAQGTKDEHTPANMTRTDIFSQAKRDRGVSPGDQDRRLA
jgi:hypothetical protein